MTDTPKRLTDEQWDRLALEAIADVATLCEKHKRALARIKELERERDDARAHNAALLAEIGAHAALMDAVAIECNDHGEACAGSWQCALCAAYNDTLKRSDNEQG